VSHCKKKLHSLKPGIERVQALADISRSALYCHSNETRAPIANPPNGAQLEGTPYHSPKLHPGPWSSVWECSEGQTDRHTDGRDQYISHRPRLTWNLMICKDDSAPAKVRKVILVTITSRWTVITWLNTVQRDRRACNLALNEAVDLAEKEDVIKYWK